MPIVDAVLDWLPVQWYVILIAAIALVLSGFLGAAISTAITTYRYRKPPIGQRIEVPPVFADVSGASCPKTQITVSDGQRDYSYHNLQISLIQLANQSHHDFESFQLTVSLPSSQGAVYVEACTPDCNHQVKQLSPVSFSEPQAKLDLLFWPFNREDRYTLRLLVATSAEEMVAEEISLSSAQAVHFVDLQTVEEAVKEAAKSTSISLGPFQFSFNR